MELNLYPKADIMSFRANGIMIYRDYVASRPSVWRSSKFTANAELLQKRKRYIGEVTPAMVKRMKRAITLLIQSTPTVYVENQVINKVVPHHLSFVTLTIPKSANVESAKWCHKKLLEPFLRIMRRKWRVKSYIWKCELQKNGTPHYHITSDLFTNHVNIRNEWNHLMKKHGLLDDYKKEYGHYNPNSTDVHSVKKINNLEAYIVKYITKSFSDEEKLDAKVWDCSKNLKRANYFRWIVDEKIADYLNSLNDSLLTRVQYFERALFFDFKCADYYSFFSSEIVSNFGAYLNSVREGVTSALESKWKKLCQQSSPTICQLQNYIQTSQNSKKSAISSLQSTIALSG